MVAYQDKIHLTKEGLADIKREYRELIEVKRPQVVERLASARQMGDLAENSEYTHAKEELSFIDGRIEELKNIINNVVLINNQGQKPRAVGLGCRVTVQIGEEEEQVFHLVGEWEADPTKKKISHKSPLGRSLLGKKVGEQVAVEAPVGKIVYTIKKID